MSTTTFYDGSTVIYASWLNDANNAVYNGTFPNGILNPTTVNAVSVNATNGTFTNIAFTTLVLPNNWVITTTASKLYFSNNGTNVASLDTSGNFKSLANVTAGGTP